MAQPFIAGIVMFAGNFAPRSYAFCQGQILSIAQNTALFSLLGTTYGGNGTTTFALPDLRGRVPIGPGQGPGLSPYVLGQQSGTPTVTLLTTEMPAHVHAAAPGGNNTDSNPNSVKSPQNAVFGYSDDAPLYAPASNTTMGASTSGITGSTQPHENMQPYLGLYYIIALQGIFPSRN
ncbi:MAG: tail fiber protein, partial [Pyrinomonadaceae bacterium]